MKGKADRQKDLKGRYRIIGVEQMKNMSQIGIQKIKIFVEHQDAYIAYNAEHKPGFPSSPAASSDQVTCHIINQDGGKKNEDVFRHKSHIKQTAAEQQKYPSASVRQSKISTAYKAKKNKKLKGVKKHAAKPLPFGKRQSSIITYK
jgi:hypothetical protein